MGQRFCTNCGHEIVAGDLFCTVCGTRIDAAAEASETPAAAASAPAETPIEELFEPAAPPVAPPARPTAQAPAPAETTAVRRPAPPRRPRRNRSRAGFWAWIVLAAIVVAAVSYGLGSLATRDGDERNGSASGAAGESSVGASSAGAEPSRAASSGPAAPDPQALAQAKALHTLIQHSATDKQRIAVAAAQLQGCHHIKDAIQTFEDAASSRDRLVDQASDLQVGLLPGGGAAIASFGRALRASADADRAFVAWGQARHKVTVKKHHHRRTTCKGGKTLQHQAVQLSTASHAPKQQTAREWNVIAAQFELPKIEWTIL